MSQQLLDVLKQQRRRRRLRFWAGFLTILLLGGLWAQLSKDPFGPEFGDNFVEVGERFEEAPAVEVFEQAPTTVVDFLDQPTTTAVEDSEPVPTTVVEP